jgi:hypothetical protein
MTSSEDNKFPFLFHFFKESNSIRSNIESDFILCSIEIDGNFDVGFSRIGLVAMNDCFIQVNEQSFFVRRCSRNNYLLIIPFTLKIHFYEFILQ